MIYHNIPLCNIYLQNLICILRLLMKDKNYNKISTEQSKDEKAYMKLRLSKKQRNMVDKLLSVTERTSMDALRELYIISSELKQTEDALKESDRQLFDYMKYNFSEKEKMVFYDTINSILRIREEYFFKTGFKTAVKLLSDCF